MHLFSVSGLRCGLVHQLLIHTGKDNGALPCGEIAEMVNRRLHILDAVGQMLEHLSEGLLRQCVCTNHAPAPRA